MYVTTFLESTFVPSIKVGAREVDSIATDKHVSLQANLQDGRGTDWTNHAGYERLSSGSFDGTSDVHKLKCVGGRMERKREGERERGREREGEDKEKEREGREKGRGRERE